MLKELKEISITALKEGLFLTVKYGLLVFIIWFAFNYSMQTRQAAANGEQAAIAIAKFQQKGWLPQFVNGDVPPKPIEDKKKEE